MERGVIVKRLGYYLKKKRSQLLLYQEQASAQIGVSRVRYSDMENDKVYSYDPETLKAVANWLGESTDWVLEKVPKKPKQQ